MPATRRTSLSLFLLLALLAGCASAPRTPFHATEPANLGLLKRELTHYHDDGQYQRDIAAVATRAIAFIERRAPQVAHPAIVLDIDETVLSNWPSMLANDFGYIHGGACDTLPSGPCGNAAWEDRGEAEAIAPMLDLYRRARAIGVEVYFVTGRSQARRGGTEKNLEAAGFTGFSGLMLKPSPSPYPNAIAYKSAQRAAIEARGRTIIASIGDQDSDLLGGHAERRFKLPNPFYFLD